MNKTNRGKLLCEKCITNYDIKCMNNIIVKK